MRIIFSIVIKLHRILSKKNSIPVKLGSSITNRILWKCYAKRQSGYAYCKGMYFKMKSLGKGYFLNINGNQIIYQFEFFLLKILVPGQ